MASSGNTLHISKATMSAATKSNRAITLEMLDSFPWCVKDISGCLFGYLYSSIDARTHLFSGPWHHLQAEVYSAKVFVRMRITALAAALVIFSGVAFAQAPAQTSSAAPRPVAQNQLKQAPIQQTQIMTVDEVRPGMKGVAYTVFQGTQPESMGVEVLGVLKNMNGPKSDVILVRLHGEKAEYTGVVAGMSGSPVYIDGKMLGAIAYRIGQFSKEPIAGVTPIAQMLEINEFDNSIPQQGSAAANRPAGPEKTSGTGATDMSAFKGVAQYLQPIDAPFVFNGFTEASLKQFGAEFAQAGITPVMGVGSVSDAKQPEPLVPGSAVSAIMVRGDMDVAATCTVTYMDKDHLLACGHPLMQFGMVDMPMTKATVVTTLASPLNSFKIINTTEPIGAWVQ